MLPKKKKKKKQQKKKPKMAAGCTLIQPMFDFNAPTPTGFHADFALCVMIPLAEAAYAVMNQPGVAPQLPPGFQMTGLIQADETLRQAILNLPNQSNVAKAMMDDSGIFGLMGKNPAHENRVCRLPRHADL